MKKKLLLLPLAALMLTGCKITLFGKTIYLFEKKPTEGGSTQPEDNTPVEAKDFEMDFSQDAVTVDQYVALDTEMSFTFEGQTYKGIGCYDETNNHYLMMKNKQNNGEGADPTYSTKLAFFSSARPFSKPIKEVSVVLNDGDYISTNTVYRVVIGNKAVTAAVESGGVSGVASKTEQVTLTATSSASDAYYFSVSTNLSTSGKRYNGQLLKVSVKF